jgi:hypothetical protein
MKRLVIGVSILLAFFACKSKQQGVEKGVLLPTEETILFAIDKGPCFGKCPVYAYQITTSGKVYYQGKEFSQPEGLYQFVLLPATIKWLDAQIVAARLQNLEDEYLCNISDATTTTVTAFSKGFSKTIVHRCGEEIQELLDLEQRVDSVVFHHLLSK